MAESQGTQKLNFASAMDDFRVMFPHLDIKLIETVLRRNNGMVDQTIDDLLAINCVNEEEAGPSQIIDTQTNLLHQPGSANRSYPTLSAHLPPGDLTLTPRSSQQPHTKYGQVPVTFLGVTFPIPYTQPLPDRFLRLNEQVAPTSSPMASQMAEDRDFALLLHNRDLLQQMQSDSEFMTTLQAGNPPKHPGVSAARSIDEVSFAQRLSETGRTTRSKLLKIARKLDWRRPAGSSRLRQPLLSEEDTDVMEPLFTEGGDETLMYTDMEEDDGEVLKTIPRQNTLAEFESNRERAREAVARQFRGERAPPPPIPPPGPPSSSSTLSGDNYSSRGGTLDSIPTIPRDLSQKSPPLLDLCLDDDPIYESDTLRSRGSTLHEPEYADTDAYSVSNMSDVSAFSLGREREIHSSTLNSSYLIPIRTFTEQDSEQYDNLNCNNTVKEESLIKF